MFRLLPFIKKGPQNQATDAVHRAIELVVPARNRRQRLLLQPCEVSHQRPRASTIE